MGLSASANRYVEGDNMLTDSTVLLVAFGTLIVIWIAILAGSPYFGSPPEH